MAQTTRSSDCRTSDSRKNWFKVGDYKLVDNEVGGIETTLVKDVKKEMEIRDYNDSNRAVSLLK